MVMRAEAKEDVRRFWDAQPCGGKHASAPEGAASYFREVEAARDRLEPFIARYAQFDAAAGKSLLEVGVGLGTDLTRFGRAGARLTGIDLTQRSIDLVSRRLAAEGLAADLRIADAEALPFEDGTFDVVYSWGVLHHTPDTEQAVAEALRVLKPGGRFTIMLYARHSWVALGLWGRYGLLRGRPWRTLTDVVANHMESPGTRAFSRAEVRAMVGRGTREIVVQHVGTPYDRRVAGPLAAVSGGRLGWFLVATGVRA
jgi:SAM-dependent methyltransferase